MITLLAIALGAAVLLGCWSAFRLTRRRRTPVRLLVVVVTGVALGLLGVQAWARAAIDQSTLARAIVWLDADTGDLHRFPARRVPAGGQPVALESSAAPTMFPDAVDVPGRGELSIDELLETTDTTALIVLQGQDVLLERYANGGGPDVPHTSFSTAKSVLSTVVGIALERGDLGSLDDPVTRYVPELAEQDPRFADIRLRDLMTMSSGIRYTETSTPWGDDAATYYAPDLRRVALSAEIAEPPRQRWHYNNYNPLIMGLVLERATGRNLADYLSEVLWVPLGAEGDASWSLDSEASGFEKMESGFNALPRDYARFGLLFAGEGAIDGRRVVPPQWVAEATALDTSTDPAAHYQYWWWVDTERPGRFYASGNHGQFVYVDPEQDIVVVRLGRSYGGVRWPPVLRDLADRVERR